MYCNISVDHLSHLIPISPLDGQPLMEPIYVQTFLVLLQLNRHTE